MTASGTELEASWSHIQETLAMLQLSTAQIRSSMLDGDQSISELGGTLTAIAASANKLHHINPESVDEIQNQSEQIIAEVQRGLVACQFHDRVTQRLNHVTDALSQLGHLIENPKASAEQAEWEALQAAIKNSYTMESERIMYEHIMMGASVESALEIYQHHFNNVPLHDASGDDVELF